MGEESRSRWHWLALGALTVLLAATAPGCGGGGGDGGGGGGGEAPVDDSPASEMEVTPPAPALGDTEMRLQFIQSVGNGFILPTYGDMVDASADLIDGAGTFCTNPDEGNLTAAQEHWRTVAGLWAESELVKFGPEVRNLVHDDIDVPRGRHADAPGMESRIAGGGAIDASRLPTTQRGLEGVEYLLFGDMERASEILAGYTGATGPRRCQYLEAIIDDLHTNIRKFYDSWRPDGDDYLNDWNTAGDPGNSAYIFVQEAVQELMGEMEFVLDDLVNVKIAGYKPGARRPWVDGEPESWRSGNSIANIRHRVQAAEMIYLGANRATGQDGFGIDDYLRRTGEASLDAEIQDQFDTTLNALDNIPGTLKDAVSTGATEVFVETAEVESRVLLRLLKRDLTVEQLDVFFPGFNDADGD